MCWDGIGSFCKYVIFVTNICSSGRRRSVITDSRKTFGVRLSRFSFAFPSFNLPESESSRSCGRLHGKRGAGGWSNKKAAYVNKSSIVCVLKIEKGKKKKKTLYSRGKQKQIKWSGKKKRRKRLQKDHSGYSPLIVKHGVLRLLMKGIFALMVQSIVNCRRHRTTIKCVVVGRSSSRTHILILIKKL